LRLCNRFETDTVQPFSRSPLLARGLPEPDEHVLLVEETVDLGQEVIAEGAATVHPN